MVSFAIIGSTLLVILTILLQVNRYYKPKLNIDLKPFEKVEEITNELHEKQKKLGESIETIINKRSIYEEVMQKYLERRKSPDIPIIVSNENINKNNLLQQRTGLGSSIEYSIQQKENEIKIQGVMKHHITILNDLGITTVHDLSKQEPELLLSRIIEWNIIQNRTHSQIPTWGMIKRWIRMANKRYDNTR